VGIGPILVQKFLGLDWTGLGRTRSGLVQCWTDGIIEEEDVEEEDEVEEEGNYKKETVSNEDMEYNVIVVARRR